jgi:hypothetical protein
MFRRRIGGVVVGVVLLNKEVLTKWSSKTYVMFRRRIGVLLLKMALESMLKKNYFPHKKKISLLDDNKG